MSGNSSSHSHTHHQNSQLNPPPPPPPPPSPPQHHQINIRDLLLCCAQLISRSDFSAASRLISFLTTHSSPYGDSSDRLTHYFTTALSLRLHRIQRQLPNHLPLLINTNTTSHHHDAILKSSYLSLNQITPFIRFCHFTANQAILETIHQYYSHHHQYNNIHILDFDIMHGVQWPPLMQTIADLNPPPSLRITSTGTDLNTLRLTGDRLFNFAHSLGLNFKFHPVLLPNDDNIDDLIHHLSGVILRPNEILAVNSVFYLHRMLKNRENLVLLLRRVKFMNPKVVTLAEKEANHNHPLFVTRFDEALKYYAAVFESFEATLPANSRERMLVEEVWFGREIADLVAAEGERHERFRSWEVMMRSGGFRNIPVSPFAVAQGKLLLRLHYPCEGYNLEVVSDSFFLGWRNQPLFSVSSWC